MNPQKRYSRINQITAFFMIGVAVMYDLSELAVDWIPFVGQFFAFMIDLVAILHFTLWFMLRKVSLTSPRRIVRFWMPMLAEFLPIPLIDAFIMTLGIVLTILSTWAEDSGVGFKKPGIKKPVGGLKQIGKNLRTVRYGNRNLVPKLSSGKISLQNKIKNPMAMNGNEKNSKSLGQHIMQKNIRQTKFTMTKRGLGIQIGDFPRENNINDSKNNNKKENELGLITGKSVRKIGSGIKGVGTVTKQAGQTAKTISRGTKLASRGVEVGGKAINKTGKVASSASSKLMQTGVKISGTGAGAVVGVPLAVVGGAAFAASKTAEVGGRVVEGTGKATGKVSSAAEKVSNTTIKTGKKIEGVGERTKQMGKGFEEEEKTSVEEERIMDELKRMVKNDKDNIKNLDQLNDIE